MRPADTTDLLRAADRVLSEAREMLGVFEDHGGHDGLQGKGYVATLDHIDELRKQILDELTATASRPDDTVEYLLSVIANYHENGACCDECPADYAMDAGATCQLWEQAKRRRGASAAPASQLPDGRVQCEYQECHEHGAEQCESKWGTIYLCARHKRAMQEAGDLE